MPQQVDKQKRLKNGKEPVTHGLICSLQGPGPIYKLKPLVGYRNHCHSKYRGPAFSISGKRLEKASRADGPGPKYQPLFPEKQGFSFGLMLKNKRIDISPGPYNIPSLPPTPAYSMKWRTRVRDNVASPGPYDISRELNGPAFTIGIRLTPRRIDGGPAPGIIKLDMVKSRSPAFSFSNRPASRVKCASPGPYDPVNLEKAPGFSFGIKHSPCSPPLITENDRVC